MFGNRPNAKKPGDGLINKFQATFSDIVRPTKHDPPGPANDDPNHLSTRGTPGLRFTPWLNDQSGLRFTPFLDDHLIPTPNTNQPYQNYGSGGLNTIFHGPAGDLHTPLVDSNLVTPKTLLEQFAVTPLHRNNIDPLHDTSNAQYFAQEAQTIAPGNLHAAYPPIAFIHSDLAEGAADGVGEAAILGYVDNRENGISRLVKPQNNSLSPEKKRSSHDNHPFRYQVSLNTPTAMINDPNRPPVTYLNKAQIYPLSIVDTVQPASNQIVKYRTWIRVTFEDDEQASNPAASWALWKETRGHEAYRKDGKLYAIEFVGLFQENESQNCNHIQLERILLDGFCVTWYSDPTRGKRGCSMGVRFHFLSTDFSHTKGVKGVPIRLCAKTETITPGPAEISYCKVKLFREHGAERKMFNDVSQLKRAIERRRQDFAKAESGGEHLGKRKRGSRSVLYKSDKELEDERKDQLQKSLGEDLAMMQNRFYSNRPVTNFCLPGSIKDDPDLFPIKMEDNQTQSIARVDQPTLQTLTPPSTLDSVSRNLSYNSTDHRSPTSRKDPNPPILALSTGKAELTSINSKPKAPVACFYLRFQKSGAQQDDYHTAVYLTERTANELMAKISHKQRFKKDHIVQLFQIKNGRKIIIDDDVVQRIPDGQNIIADVSGISSNMATGCGSIVEVRLDF